MRLMEIFQKHGANKFCDAQFKIFHRGHTDTNRQNVRTKYIHKSE